MRNLIKKSLAFCLVAALALTCFVGSVSAAETYSATISVANQTITQGTTSVDVVLDIASADAGINEALIKVSSTLGTIASEATVVESDSAAVIEYDQGTTDYGTFFLSAQNVESETGTALGSVKSAKIKLTFTVAADVAVGDYDIVIDIPDDKVIAASANEDIINFTYTTAKVTVEAATVECEHEWELSSATAATESSVGSVVFACTKCDATETNDVKYIRFARANNQSLILEAEISIGAQVYDRDLVRCNEAGANGVCSEYFVQFSETRPDATEPVVSYAFSADAKAMTEADTGRTYGLLTCGLRSIDMVNNVAITVFAKVDGQWVTGEVKNASVQTLSNTLLSAAGTATETKTLVVDMLNYGAAAQVNFDVNTENLPSIAGYESFASTGDVACVDNSSWAASSSETAPFTTTGIALELSSKILLRPNLQFGNKYYANYADKYDGMKIVVAYTNFLGREIEQEYVNVTVDPDGEYVFESTDGVRKFGMSVDIFTPADLRQTYTIKAYTADGTLLNADIISSVESSAYVIRANAVTAGNTKLVNLVDAMLRYGDSAKVAFS